MEEELDLKEVFKSFWDRKIGIAIIMCIFICIGIIYTYMFTKPVFSATSKVILATNVGQTEGADGSKVTQGEITLNNSLLTTYSEIATSDTVLSKVITNLGLNNLNMATLRESITVTSTKNSQIIEITVKNADPNLAMRIANELKTAFAERVFDIYKMDNIQPFEDAKLPGSPSNINHKKDIIMFTAIGLALGIVYAIVANLLDNTVKSAKDIEKVTGLNVIAELPVYDFGRGRKK